MATITINTASNNPIEATIPVNQLLGDNVDLYFTTTSGNGGTIDWGDGTVENYTNNNPISHTYLNSSNQIKITCQNGLSDLITFSYDSFGLNVIGNVSIFNNFNNLQVLGLKGSTNSNIIDIPSSLLELYIDDELNGNIINLPQSLIKVRINGINSITGNIANFSLNLLEFELKGGNNTLFGDIDDIPINIKELVIEGNNIIEGDYSLTNQNLESLIIKGLNNIMYNNSRTFKVFKTNITVVELNPCKLSVQDVDDLLIDLNTFVAGITNSSNLIKLIGGSRSSTSDTAYNNLVSKGYTITF